MEVATAVRQAVNGRRLLSIARNHVAAWAPVLILVMALGLRLYGIDWDQGGLFHPDERAILMNSEPLSLPLDDPGLLLNAEESPWNPNWFPYGSLPLYLIKGVQLVSEYIRPLNIFELRIPGRVISALADSLTVLMIFVLGRRFYGRNTGLLAAGLTGLAVIHIQLSHFYAVDTLLTLFIVASVFFSVRVAQHGRRRDSVLAGIFIGLGLAIKVSIAPIVLIFLLAHLLRLFSRDDQTLQLARATRARVLKSFQGVVLAAAGAAAVFFVAQPYALLDWPVISLNDDGFGGVVRAARAVATSSPQGIDGNRFVRDVAEQSAMVRRSIDLPYTRQYVDTTAYWYHIKQLGLWGLGLPLGIVAWLALPYGIFRAAATRRKSDLIIVSWVLLYFLIVGSFEVKFMRYLLPITPFMILMGSHMTLGALRRLRSLGSRPAALGAVGMAALLGFTAFYALSYETVYARPHPAQEASRWINDNVPQGSVILKEHWEEGLPELYQYQVRELPMYEEDTAGKVEHMSSLLAEADYVAFYSQRLYATVTRLEERYPISREYYRLLFSGGLGYELAHFETSYPSLLGVSFVDETFGRADLPTPAALASYGPSPLSINMGVADESFTVYDHPKVMVFENAGRLSANEIEELLLAGGAGARDGRQLGLVYSEADFQAQQQGGTWTTVVQTDGWPNRLPVVSWLLLIEGISILALPLTLFIFRPLPDRGYLFSKIVALLLTSYAVWLLASLKWMAFSRASITAALVLLFVVSLVVMAWRGREIVDFIKARWRLLAAMEALFLLAFVVFMLIRMANPDLWHPFRGGEKPMDFAYLNAVLRSTYMPPYDPWFAGGFLNYYYMGQFMVATLIKATGIEPAVAYNLAVPLFFALTVGGAFTIVYNLAEATRRRLGGGGFSWTPLAAGVVAALFVTVLGNLDGVVQVAQGAGRALFQSQPFGTFDFWRSTRLMPPDPPGFEINEFPYFTFLFADLHAHLMAIPFTLLVVGLGLALVAKIGRARNGVRGLLEEALQLGLLALAVGSLRTLNTWDYPTYMIIAGATICLVEYLRQGGLSFAVLARAAAKVGIVYGASQLLFLPFLQSYQVFYTGLEPTVVRTALWQFLLINGLFVFVIASFMIYESRQWIGGLMRRRRSAQEQPREEQAAPVLPARRTLRARRFALALVSTAAVLAATAFAANALVNSISDVSVFGLVKDFLVSPAQPIRSAPYDAAIFTGVLLVLAAALGLKWLWSWGADSAYMAFAVILLGMALLLAFGVDFARVEGDIDRMNTVFKFYLQVWVLLALVSAYFLWRVFLYHREARAKRESPVATEGSRRRFYSDIGLGKRVWVGVLALLVLCASIYPLMGTQARLRDRFDVKPLTLNGAAYVQDTVYQGHEGPIDLETDYRGLRWLQMNVEGSPVILEGSTPTYRWGGRVSIYTGLPSVIGWQWHQTQQRFDYRWAVDMRIDHVNRIYSTTSPREAMSLLQRYGVKYVYVGELERLYYPEEGIRKFQQMEGAELDSVYRNEKVTIYRVRHG